MAVKDFILASGSPERHRLLQQICCEPKQIIPADIDENILPHERPLPYVCRMALQKAQKVAADYTGENILAGDTIVTVGLRIIQKSKTPEQQASVMRLLSGRNHRVISAVCLIDKNGKISQRVNTTRVAMKRLSDQEIADYVNSREWEGVCGYRIDGMLAGYVRSIIGSYSGVVGLPLFETRNLLIGAGIK